MLREPPIAAHNWSGVSEATPEPKEYATGQQQQLERVSGNRLSRQESASYDENPSEADGFAGARLPLNEPTDWIGQPHTSQR